MTAVPAGMLIHRLAFKRATTTADGLGAPTRTWVRQATRPVGAANGGSSATVALNQVVSATGGGGSHNHTFTGTAINLAVQYVDVIIATKN